MERLAQYISADDAPERLRQLCRELGADEIAVVRNLRFVFSPIELYPLAPKNPGPLPRIVAFAVDMDGTSTTTEPLALHALEYMVRRVTGRLSPKEWSGLDPELDHPFVIGNSNFRHTEFLLDRYRDAVRPELLASSFIESVLWTLSNMEDERRRDEVVLNASNCGLGCMLHDPDFLAAIASPITDSAEVCARAEPFVRRFYKQFRPATPSAEVAAALDIYYTRYHTILEGVARGDCDRLSRELLCESGKRLIEPMPGYAIFLALVKGLLGEEAGELAPLLGGNAQDADTLRVLGAGFGDAPAKVALVTASIAHEAQTVVGEVFRTMAKEAETWPVSREVRERVSAAFSDHREFYDGFVTASDCSESRLKPHRDLYSIALYRMGVCRDEYSCCVGLEDTEPGIIALRAAGVGCAVALPNHDTSLQNYHAASHIVHGGLPELLLRHRLFLR